MNARNSALHEMFSKIADLATQAANDAAFFMDQWYTKFRYLYIFGTFDPVAKMMHYAQECERRAKNNL